MYGLDLIDTPCVGAAEDEGIVHIAAGRADERHADAVLRRFRVAGLQAVEAGFRRDSFRGHSLDERIEQRAAHHVHRAVYEGDVLFFRLYVHFLKCLRGVAFPGRHEAGRHLHAGEAEREVVLNVFPVEDAAAEYDGDLALEFFFKGMDDGEDLEDLFFIAVIFVFRHLFAGVAQMAAGLRAFDDDQIGGALMMARPHVEQDFRRFRRRNDGSDLDIGAFHEAGQIHGEARAGDDEVRAAFDSAFHVVVIVVAAGHDVDADDAVRRGLTGFFQFLLEDAAVRFETAGEEIRFIEAGLRGGDDADAAFFRHGARQPGKADADAHAALDDGIARGEIADFKFWKFHT